MSQSIILVIIGFTAGILGGMLGLGGAIIIIPALVMLLGFSQQNAQGTTLLMMVFPVGAMAAWEYYRQGQVNIKAAVILGITFFVGGYFGAKWANDIPTQILKKAFGILLVAIAIKIWFFEKANS